MACKIGAVVGCGSGLVVGMKDIMGWVVLSMVSIAMGEVVVVSLMSAWTNEKSDNISVPIRTLNKITVESQRDAIFFFLSGCKVAYCK